jgi:glucose-6-phosphate-specific signal transduction histidine kinase
VRNITAQKKAYEALRQNSANLETRVTERTELLQRLNQRLTRENQARRGAEKALAEQGGQLRLLARKLLEAQETERRNLVRELHDDVGQALTAVRTYAAVIRNQHSSSDDICPRSAQTIMDLSGQLYDSIHRIMCQLRPRALDDLGLSAGLQSCIDAAGLEAAGVAVHVRIGKGLERLDETVSIAAYRLLQEALTNVLRHADAGNVWIRVACEKRPKASDSYGREVLEISIEDDGRGLPEGGVQVQRLGLLGIEERVHSVGGDLVIRNRPAGGVFLRALIPVGKGAHDG